jgi:hypothetical protein
LLYLRRPAGAGGEPTRDFIPKRSLMRRRLI